MLRLERLPWPDMRYPSIAAVRGDQPHGTVWVYSEAGEQQSLPAIYGAAGASQRL